MAIIEPALRIFHKVDGIFRKVGTIYHKVNPS